MAKPKILFLVHRVPYPPNRGDRIRSYHMLKFLAERADVSLATLADEPLGVGTNETLGRLCQQVAIEHVGRTRWLRGAMSLAAGRSATEGLFRSPRLAATIGRWSRQTRFDAIVVFCSSMVPYLDLPGLKGIPTIVDLVDVDSQKFFDYAEHARGLKRWLYRLEGHRLRRLECSLPERVQAITLVSEAEAKLYRSFCPNDRTHAITNGVDLDYFRPENDGPNPWTPLPEADRTNLVFVGALDYEANIDGVTWFAHEVWPLVRRELPDLTLGLVGRNPAPAVQRLAAIPGIRVFGSVPDVRPYLAAADLVIAPLRIARGIQNKVLEAMAMGKVVLCSPGAIEGLQIGRDPWSVTASDNAAWVASLKQLMLDGAGAVAAGRAARTYVESTHSWPTMLDPLNGIAAFGASQRLNSLGSIADSGFRSHRPASPSLVTTADVC